MELALTERASVLLHRLTAAHFDELRTLEPALTRALGRLRDHDIKARQDV